MEGFVKRLTRRKVIDFGHSELRRILGILDLTMLGVGSTIGMGIYVLAGEVSRETTGPAITVSFLIAAIASLFAGLCYAEFGARVPRAGSAYIYTYVCIGELMAFIIGWNLILEYVIGTASVARGFSQYVDALANDSIENALYEAMPLVSPENVDDSFLSPFPDFLSLGLTVTLAVTLALGVKESSRMNNIFTGINIIVILVVIVAGAIKANPWNWKIPEEDVGRVCSGNASSGNSNSTDWGTGGFAPFGFEGIMRGAATCFFGFVGFDVIATTGEEAKNPSRTIPISIGISLLIIFLAYFGVSAVITLAWPYCLQDKDAALVVLFDEDHLKMEGVKWFVSIGALFGFSASLFGAMFPLPRVIYAMASDGLVFRSLGAISKRFQTPTYATVIAGLFAGVMAMFFNLKSLVDMMSIGTLMAYTIVAVCVMLLRYSVEDEEEEETERKKLKPTTLTSYKASDYIGQLLNTKGLTKPTDLTATIVTYAIMCFCLLMLILDALLVLLTKRIEDEIVAIVVMIVIFAVLNIIVLIIIARQPQSKKELSFKVPLVPWLPAFSTFINLYLMCNLDPDTWIRFVIWMAIGFLDYFAYGMWHSSLNNGDNTEQGRDNLAFIGDNYMNGRLIIPTIEIQPATPLNSEPNTPASKPKEQKKVPPSPLAKKEQDGTSDSQVNKVAINGVGNAAVISVSVLPDSDANDEGTMGNDKSDSEGKEDNHTFETNDIKEEVLEINTKSLKEDINHEEDIQGTDVNKEEDRNDHALSSIVITAAITEALKMEKDTEEKTIKMDDGKLNEDKTVSESDEDSNAEENEIQKPRHPKPPPLNLSSTDDKETNSLSDIKTYYSSPELSPPHSPPPSAPPSTPISAPSTMPKQSKPLVHSASEKNTIHSVPSTPVARRHPRKVLRRMSSFDDIPPSSPDSPFAVRVSSFVVIPVNEPGMDSNISSPTAIPSTPTSPSEDINKAMDKLKMYKKEEDKRDSKMFTVGSTDSLNSISSEQGDNMAESISSRGLGRELDMLTVLDPIRERGESKLYSQEGDKTDIPAVQ